MGKTVLEDLPPWVIPGMLPTVGYSWDVNHRGLLLPGSRIEVRFDTFDRFEQKVMFCTLAVLCRMCRK